MNHIIETHGLSKTFDADSGWRRLARTRAKSAVVDVSLAVERGELFGLLGPNGAGKTTLVKMLCTLVAPTSGSAIIAGHPLSQSSLIRRRIGLVVTDERSFYWRLSAQHNLEFFAAMFGLHGAAARRRVAAVLAAVELSDQADVWFNKFSTGMKQRLAIARALLHEPELLFLDEPSRSLDPRSTRHLHALIRQLMTQKGVTVFLITHDMNEAEALCTRLAVMHEGAIRAIGEPAELRHELGLTFHYTITLDAVTPALQTVLEPLVANIVVNPAENQVSFAAPERGAELEHALARLRASGRLIQNIQGAPASLDDVFEHFTNQKEPS